MGNKIDYSASPSELGPDLVKNAINENNFEALLKIFDVSKEQNYKIIIKTLAEMLDSFARLKRQYIYDHNPNNKERFVAKFNDDDHKNIFNLLERCKKAVLQLAPNVNKSYKTIKSDVKALQIEKLED